VTVQQKPLWIVWVHEKTDTPPAVGVINQPYLGKASSGTINVVLMFVTPLLKQLTCSIHFEIVYGIKTLKCLLSKKFIWVYFENGLLKFLEIFMELQLLLIEYFVLWSGFSFELSGDAKRNTVNRLIIDVQKLYEWTIVDINQRNWRFTSLSAFQQMLLMDATTGILCTARVWNYLFLGVKSLSIAWIP